MKDVSSREMNIYGKLLALDSPEADRLRRDWHEPKVGANDLKIGSRSINYYEAIGLIRDPRGGEKKGWRKYSYIECVYLSIVRELRHYGINTDYIKTFYDTFVKDDDELFTNSILLAHLGYKMTIVIGPNQKEHIFDTNDLVNRENEKEDSEEEFSKAKYRVQSSQIEDATSQAAMIVIDHENGQVKGCVRRIR